MLCGSRDAKSLKKGINITFQFTCSTIKVIIENVQSQGGVCLRSATQRGDLTNYQYQASKFELLKYVKYVFKGKEKAFAVDIQDSASSLVASTIVNELKINSQKVGPQRKMASPAHAL